MDLKARISESKKLEGAFGTLRGNRFKVQGVWFVHIATRSTGGVSYCTVKNEVSGAEKIVKFDDLKKVIVDEVGMASAEYCNYGKVGASVMNVESEKISVSSSTIAKLTRKTNRKERFYFNSKGDKITY